MYYIYYFVITLSVANVFGIPRLFPPGRSWAGCTCPNGAKLKTEENKITKWIIFFYFDLHFWKKESFKSGKINSDVNHLLINLYKLYNIIYKLWMPISSCLYFSASVAEVLCVLFVFCFNDKSYVMFTNRLLAVPVHFLTPVIDFYSHDFDSWSEFEIFRP